MNQLGKVKSRRLVVIMYIVKPLPRRDIMVIIHSAIQNHLTMFSQRDFSKDSLQQCSSYTRSSAGCLVLFALVAQQFTSVYAVNLTGSLINFQFVPISVIFTPARHVLQGEYNWHPFFLVWHARDSKIRLNMTLVCKDFLMTKLRCQCPSIWNMFRLPGYFRLIKFCIFKSFCTSTPVSYRVFDATFSVGGNVINLCWKTLLQRRDLVFASVVSLDLFS